MRIKIPFAASLFLLVLTLNAEEAGDVSHRTPLALREVARMHGGAGEENSGLVASRQWPGVFWGIGDSGQPPHLFAIRRDGSQHPSQRTRFAEGLPIGNAANIDWEDIAITDAGLLAIADVGNNANRRTDLALLILPEPDPAAWRTRLLKRVFVRYPDQHAFPPPWPENNFDCEAVFWADGHFYFLTKHRGDTRTVLYRLPSLAPDQVHTLERIDAIDLAHLAAEIEGTSAHEGQPGPVRIYEHMVTGADISPDGSRLAVLCYGMVWLFTRGPGQPASEFLQASPRMRRIQARQAEGIAFDGNEHLFITDEQGGRLYRMPLNAFPE